MSLRFIADVHISPITVQALCNAGYEAIRVTDVLPATASDAEILAWAQQHDYVVVTQDLDFSALVAIGRQGKPSLVTLRLSSAEPNEVAQRLLEILPNLERHLTQGVAATITDKAIRVRSLPI